MKAKFIEDSDMKLGLAFQAETDDERLLLRAFAAQAQDAGNRLALRGWGMGGSSAAGLREVRLYLDTPVNRDVIAKQEWCDAQPEPAP